MRLSVLFLCASGVFLARTLYITSRYGRHANVWNNPNWSLTDRRISNLAIGLQALLVGIAGVVLLRQ